MGRSGSHSAGMQVCKMAGPLGGKKPLFNDFFVSIVVIVGTLIIAPRPPKKEEQNTYIEKFEIVPGVAHLQFKLLHFLDSCFSLILMCVSHVTDHKCQLSVSKNLIRFLHVSCNMA